MGEESGDRRALFDRWAAGYDASVRGIAGAEAFPFAGYDAVIGRVVSACGAGAGMRALDLGTGTGAVAVGLTGAGCAVWGTDLSAEMIARARQRLPEAVLVKADLVRGRWPEEIAGPFERITSAYVLHEFDERGKELVLRRCRERLAEGGRVVVGDIAFETRADLERARERWSDRWDDGEHYWVADEAGALAARAGFALAWERVSACAGVFLFEPAGA